jgi:hypothetical protein
MTREQLLIFLRAECAKEGSQKDWAKAHGMSAVYVSDVLAGRREPAGKLLEALGVERVISYRRAQDND